MKQNKLAAAERLYFQTDLTNSEIAEALGISRRTIHYWIEHESWDRLKISANAMPCLIQENCYILMSKAVNDCLALGRELDRIPSAEINNITKLSQVIARLGKRITLNESFEIRNNMLEYVFKQNPDLALQLEPIIDQYLKEKAKTQTQNSTTHKTTQPGMQTPKTEDQKLHNTQLDIEENLYRNNSSHPSTTVTTNNSQTPPTPPTLPTEALAKVDLSTEASAKVGSPTEAQAKVGLSTEASAKVDLPTVASAKVGESSATPGRVNINELPHKKLTDKFFIYLKAKNYKMIPIEGQPDIPDIPDLNAITPQQLDQELTTFLDTIYLPENPIAKTPLNKPTHNPLKPTQFMNRSQRRALQKQTQKTNKKAA